MNNIRKITAPKNKMELFKWLCSGKLILNPLWQDWRYRYKFFLRTIFLSPKTFTWLEHLANYPLLGYYLSRQTNLPCKLQRPYLSSSMNNQARLQALIYHYNFLATHNDKITQAFYDDTPYMLAELTVKNEERINIFIQAEDKYSREGELSICVYDQNGVDLATLTFSIINYLGKSTLFIAGLQGSNSKDARATIQQATKACYGLFPKRLVVECAILLAKYFQLEQVLAVGNKTHIYNNWRYKSRFKQLHSDYNDFWQTLDGQADRQGLYILPSNITRKPIEDIASKKRSEYRNRYLLLDNLMQHIEDRLSHLQ
ncbi:VirK/YbjX family protein [Orbus sturtevantii]|uniref:VirK/YbjX family protein n=1 Tax=Orbus sturtevantii TaxID=3074109 RepID=UPI00370D0E39